jgi:hypothetical protein
MSTSTSSTIKVNLHAGLVKNAQREASRIGISLQDFIRMLLGNYFAKPVFEKEEYYQKLLDQAHADIQAGRYTTVRTAKELNKHLNSL